MLQACLPWRRSSDAWVPVLNSNIALYEALLSANVPAPRARAAVEALEHEMYTVLATKADLAGSLELIKQQFATMSAEFRLVLLGVETTLRAETASTCQALREELRGDLRTMAASLRDELRGDMRAMDVSLRDAMASGSASLREELIAKIENSADSLRKDMQVLRFSLVVQLGSIVTVGLGILFAALKLT